MKIEWSSLAFAFVIVLAGCGRKEEAPAAPNSQVIAAQQKTEEANRQRVAAEQKAAELERTKMAAEESSQKSQTIAIGLGFAAVIALFIGIGMGSSGRRAAASAKKAVDE
jgi:predicted small lipoprotein YifL